MTRQPAKPISPWTYSPNSETEHAEQVRLFMWKSMAERHGFNAASFVESYGMERNALIDMYPYGAVPALGLMYAVPNGGFRDKITAARLKAEGSKKGVCDVVLPVPRLKLVNWTDSGKDDGVPVHRATLINGYTLQGYCGLYLELKRLKTDTQRKGTTQDEQTDFMSDVRAQGFAAVTCYGWLNAAVTIQRYMLYGTLDAEHCTF